MEPRTGAHTNISHGLNNFANFKKTISNASIFVDLYCLSDLSPLISKHLWVESGIYEPTEIDLSKNVLLIK